MVWEHAPAATLQPWREARIFLLLLLQVVLHVLLLQVLLQMLLQVLLQLLLLPLLQVVLLQLLQLLLLKLLQLQLLHGGCWQGRNVWLQYLPSLRGWLWPHLGALHILMLRTLLQ